MSRVFLTALLLVPAVFGAEYSKDDRATAAEYLDGSRNSLSAVLETVSQAQSEFQGEPNSWTILQVLEHLMLAEDYLRGILEKTISTTAPIPDGEKLPDPGEMDKAVRKGVADRSQKAQAPRELVPEGRFANRDEAFLEFSKRREKTLEWVRGMKTDLRRVRLQSGMGPIDGHQWLLLMGAHTERHMEQIAAIMRHPGYPKP